MSEAILARQLRVGDRIDLRKSQHARVLAVEESGRRIFVVVEQRIQYMPNSPITVYRDAPEGEP